MKTQLLIAAAGTGQRLGCAGPKALVDLAGAPLLVRTLERFADLDLIPRAIITVPASFQGQFAQALAAAFPETRFCLAPGGAERQASVAAGLEMLDADTEVVVIHDAARPFVEMKAVRDSIRAAAEYGAATVAIPVSDTILQGDQEAFLESTPDRRFLWACQTPQTFQAPVIVQAHREAAQQGFLGTDDASLVRRAGGRVKLVPGSTLNFKITTPTDLALAYLIVKEGLAG